MKKMLGVILLGMLITLFAGCSSSSSSSIPTTFTISGTVRGSFAANVTINLTSGVTTSTKTASDGTYSFTGLGNGFYTVTPVLTGYTFIPVSQEVIINGANVTGQIFAETLNSPTQYFGMWTWVSGPNTSNQAGSYGTIGDAATGNVPGARSGSVSWIDSSGNLWLFGGSGYDSAGNIDLLNDLWKFDGTNWTWVSGSKTYGQAGSYGKQGSAAVGNVPGARSGSVSWIDSHGYLWLFGGWGWDYAGNVSFLNDLWKFDSVNVNWTWVNGSKTSNQAGSCGTKGVAATGNVPGARQYSISWIDSSDNLWLFGGSGYDSAGDTGYLNDLWKFDGANWTWVSGFNIYGQAGSYGTKGSAAMGNVPGARVESVSWIDSSGNLWLFGGFGYDSAGNVADYLNDLWRYQP